MRFDRVVVGILVTLGFVLQGPTAIFAAEPTLAQVKKRGQLACGVNGQLPGFSVLNAAHQWVGFEIDYCRAIAAAVLGDSSKVQFVPVTTGDRFDGLRKGTIDVLIRNSTATLRRTTQFGVRDAMVYYIDGQAVVVPRSSNIGKLAELNKGTICTLKDTPYEQRLQEWFAAHDLTVKVTLFDVQTSLYEALLAGKCQAVTQDISALAGSLVASGSAASYVVLPEIIATDPLAAYVRAGDDHWLDVVRWTHFALLEAELLGVTQASAPADRTSGTPAVRRLLGVTPGHGKALGLDEHWAYDAIAQVGNYAEIYDRNVGAGSPLRFARGINALWSNGGAMYPLSFR